MRYHILFIGNSYTFFEKLLWLFADVCRQAGKDVHAFMLTYPGCDWRWHYSSYCALPNIRFGKYDYVVIQQKSHPFGGEEAFLEQGAPLLQAINKTGAIAVLMNTWSEKSNPGGQKTIDEAFTMLHNTYPESLVAKCGAAWHALRGDMELMSTEQMLFAKRICKKSKYCSFDSKTSLFAVSDALLVCLDGFADTRRKSMVQNFLL
ncbi:MAG: hypothetical protein GX111_11635 [Clostridiales bacterium]|nr:hypothetical protein [Clostridiales bacterium]